MSLHVIGCPHHNMIGSPRRPCSVSCRTPTSIKSTSGSKELLVSADSLQNLATRSEPGSNKRCKLVCCPTRKRVSGN